jgi:geranylgeranyl diphosphate synthase type II
MAARGVEEYLLRSARRVDRALDRFLPRATETPATLHEAIRYAVLPGGKRIRPAVAIASCEAFGGRAEDAVPAACAVELIHCYSLVHDDLPCMDDADTRRGRPSCHVKFGEAMAVLVGDALQAMAFEAVSKHPQAAALSGELARFAGSRGLVGGQVLDLRKGPGDAKGVREIHLRKTAALFECSSRMGAWSSGRRSASDLDRAGRFGRALGLLFQAVDDLLDREEEPDKLTVPGVLGVEGALAEAKRLARAARKAAVRAPRFAQIADFVLGQVPPLAENGHVTARRI